MRAVVVVVLVLVAVVVVVVVVIVPVLVLVIIVVVVVVVGVESGHVLVRMDQADPALADGTYATFFNGATSNGAVQLRNEQRRRDLNKTHL